MTATDTYTDTPGVPAELAARIATLTIAAEALDKAVEALAREAANIIDEFLDLPEFDRQRQQMPGEDYPDAFSRAAGVERMALAFGAVTARCVPVFGAPGTSEHLRAHGYSGFGIDDDTAL